MNIALIGYGKMGKAIEAEIERMRRSKGKVKPKVTLKVNTANLNVLTPENLKKADVAIEFTTPHTAYANVLKCFEAGIPVVCGSTGWTAKLPEARVACKKKNGAFLYASNFSIGVNLFFEVNRYLAQLMDVQPQYDVTLHEIHHIEKKDAPSGTAITLAETMMSRLSRKKKWVNRTEVRPSELSIRSYREKDVPGIHLVNYESEFDSIELKHTAHTRRGFALGALHAAIWLKGKKGCFEMKDMLGIGVK